MTITFDNNLITGNETIDTQHKELIDRIQQFVTACESGDGKIKAIKMLDYLDAYTDFHFKEEETLQEKVAYPELVNHHAKHEEFKKTIQELYEYFSDRLQAVAFLKECKLYAPCCEFYEYPIDYLHHSLPDAERNSLYYHFGRFLTDLEETKGGSAA